MKVVIIGGHGKVAMHLAGLLADRGDQVTSWVRNPDHVDEVAATGATPAVVDVELCDVDEMAGLLAGRDAVVWSAGAGGGDPTRTAAVDRDAAIRSIDAAAAAGVRRYVMVSYFGARPDHGVPADHSFHAYAEAKAAADEHLRSSGLDWTVLGPSGLTDDPGTGRIESGGGVSPGQVRRADVAAVAAAVLAAPATIGRTIEFNSGDVPIDRAIAVAT